MLLDRVQFHGSLYSIHTCSTPTKLLEFTEMNTEGYTREQLLEEAEAAIDKYVMMYRDRFQFIGEPGNPTDIEEATDLESEVEFKVLDMKVHLLECLQWCSRVGWYSIHNLCIECMRFIIS